MSFFSVHWVSRKIDVAHVPISVSLSVCLCVQRPTYIAKRVIDSLAKKQICGPTDVDNCSRSVSAKVHNAKRKNRAEKNVRGIVCGQENCRESKNSQNFKVLIVPRGSERFLAKFFQIYRFFFTFFKFIFQSRNIEPIFLQRNETLFPKKRLETPNFTLLTFFRRFSSSEGSRVGKKRYERG